MTKPVSHRDFQAADLPVASFAIPFLPLFLLTLIWSGGNRKAVHLRKSERRTKVEARWALRRRQEAERRLSARFLTYQKCLQA